MTPRNVRPLPALGLALALVLAGAAGRDAHASPIPFSTIGTVTTPTGGVPGLVSFNGTSTGSFDPANPSSINLGTFVVSSLAGQAGTPNVTYDKDPFEVIVYAGAEQSVKLAGTISGVVGPTVATPTLQATLTSVNPYGNQGLPFTLSPMLNTPMTLSLPTGGSSSSSATGIVAAASPVPEPASVAVFAAAACGLVLYRRRAAR